jgi:LacI family transcriptional regulator
MSDIVFPPLTTLRISRKEYAGMLFKALQMAGKDLTKPGHKFTLATRLVVRQSTGPVPVGNRRPTGRKPGRAATRKAH